LIARLELAIDLDRLREMIGSDTLTGVNDAPTTSRRSRCQAQQATLKMDRPTPAEGIKKLQNAEAIAVEASRFMTCSLGRNSLSRMADCTTSQPGGRARNRVP
jgi:hypothetical protein